MIESVSTAEFKGIKDPCERARYLRDQGHTVREIAAVMERGISTIQGWLTNPHMSTRRGRKPLLNEELDAALAEIVRARALEHKALEYRDIREQVNYTSILTFIFNLITLSI